MDVSAHVFAFWDPVAIGPRPLLVNQQFINHRPTMAATSRKTYIHKTQDQVVCTFIPLCYNAKIYMTEQAKKHTQIKKLTQELLTKLEIKAEVTVSDNDGATLVTLETEEGGILIGYHGRNLESLQILLGQMVFKTLGTWERVVVTVGDYRQRREQEMKEMALQSAEKVVETKEPVVLVGLTPAERRTVHMVLTEHPEVMSESSGEGRDRKLTIKLKE